VDERRRSMLCPVRWRTASNWLIVMTAAVPLTETEKDKLIDSEGLPRLGLHARRRWRTVRI
jgi:hypothetical protein